MKSILCCLMAWLVVPAQAAARLIPGDSDFVAVAELTSPPSVLRSIVSITLADQPLGSAIDQIAGAAGIRISYGNLGVGAARRVTVRVRREAVGTVIERLLWDHGLGLYVHRGSGALIVQQTAMVEGTVSSAATGDPVSGVRIMIEGTRLEAISDGTGAFTIRGVPLGRRIVAATRPGFRRSARSVDVQSASAIRIDFAMDAAPVQLEELSVQERNQTGYQVESATTGTKTNVPNLETPLQVQVVTQALLHDQGVIRLDQAVENVSGVFAGNAGGGYGNDYSIRGMQGFEYSRNGVRVQAANTGSGRRETANLEQVEVLKGPAAALYGRSQSPGGLINLVTKQPSAQRAVSVRQEFGSFSNIRTTLDVTGPLNRDTTLLYRVNAAYQNAGSHIDFIEENRIFVSPVVRWHLSDKTQATFEVEYLHGADPSNYGTPSIDGRPMELPRSRNVGEAFNGWRYTDVFASLHWSHAFTDRWVLRHRFDVNRTRSDVRVIGPSALEADGRTLSRYAFAIDQTFTFLETTVDLNGEFRTGGLRHSLLAGIDYYRVRGNGEQRFTDFPSIDVINPVYAGEGALAFGPDDASPLESDENWYAAYLQDQVRIGRRVHMLLGLRFDASTPQYSIAAGRREQAITPRFGLVVQPAANLSLYGNYIENFGGTNFGVTRDGSELPPQSAQQWEAGLKVELAGRRLTASVAAFDLRKQNVSTSDPDDPAFTRPVGEVHSHGLEIDVSGQPARSWNVFVGYALTKAEISKDNDGYQGMLMHSVPRHGLSLWTAYDFHTAGLTGLRLGGGVVARSERQGDWENTVQLPGYTLANVFGSYAWLMGSIRMTAQLNVNNVFNASYWAASAGFRNGMLIGTPRTFLASLRADF